MLLDRPKEEIARDLLAQATSIWGPERAEALRAQIETTAEALALIAQHPLGIEGDEPDFLVAPAAAREVE